MNFLYNYLKLLLLIYYFNIIYTYIIPEPELKLLSPKGFQISISHEEGIKLFAFHGSINRALKDGEPGDFNGESLQPIYNRWIYENNKKFLMPGDKLNFWIYVQHNSNGFKIIDQSITITGPIETDYRASNSGNLSANKNSKNCILSKTLVKGKSVCQGNLIFEDNFNEIDWNKWQRENRIPLDTDDADFVSYLAYDKNLYINNSYLHIVPSLLTDHGFTRDSIRRGTLDLNLSCTAITDNERECKRKAEGFRILPPIASARIRSKNFFSFRYGKIEIRAQLPTGDWIFPQIFLEPLNNSYGSIGYASGQMRVAFIRGNTILTSKEIDVEYHGKRLYGGCILASDEQSRNISLKSFLNYEHLGKKFHTYSLTWTDEYITLGIDNKDYATIIGGFKETYKTNIDHAASWQNGEFMAPFDKEFYLALGVSAGGISDFPEDCYNGLNKIPKPWSNTSPKAELRFWQDCSNWYNTWHGENAGLIVDYIKVYAL